MLIAHCRLILAGSTKQCTRLYSAAAPATSTQPKESLAIEPGPPAPLPTSSGERVVAPNIKKLVDQIASLSLLDIAELNEALKKKLGIKDRQVVPAGIIAASTKAAKTSAAPDKEKQPKVEEKKKALFNVKLVSFDPEKKVELIKEIRRIMPNTNLVQAKKFIESAPVDLKTDLTAKEAEDLKKEISKFGATVEVV
uniref:Mitochondrial ribosomal protein L12 n=1 Tax=Acrobeloides nanus TaxID=290746 RepID=A0A914E425_9BILA